MNAPIVDIETSFFGMIIQLSTAMDLKIVNVICLDPVWCNHSIKYRDSLCDYVSVN